MIQILLISYADVTPVLTHVSSSTESSEIA